MNICFDFMVKMPQANAEYTFSNQYDAVLNQVIAGVALERMNEMLV